MVSHVVRRAKGRPRTLLSSRKGWRSREHETGDFLPLREEESLLLRATPLLPLSWPLRMCVEKTARVHYICVCVCACVKSCALRTDAVFATGVVCASPARRLRGNRLRRRSAGPAFFQRVAFRHTVEHSTGFLRDGPTGARKQSALPDPGSARAFGLAAPRAEL